jgi:hypothetical protein
MPDFASFLNEYGAASLDKQKRLLALLQPNAKGRFDLRRGMMAFSDGHIFAAQVLGVESESSRTWRWGWADDSTQLPQVLLNAARQLRDAGRGLNIPQLAKPVFGLDVADGRTIALVASGICQADCFFRVHFQGHALYMLLTAPPVRNVRDDSPGWVAQVYLSLIQNFPVDHRGALAHYLRFKGYRYEWHGPVVTASSPRGRVLRVEFDAQGKLARMNLGENGAASGAGAVAGGQGPKAIAAARSPAARSVPGPGGPGLGAGNGGRAAGFNPATRMGALLHQPGRGR